MFKVEVHHDGTTRRIVSPTGDTASLNGGQLLHLANAVCVANDMFREARLKGLTLKHVIVTADGGFTNVSTGISYSVQVQSDEPREKIDALLEHVDAIAEVPNSLRRGTSVQHLLSLVP